MSNGDDMKRISLLDNISILLLFLFPPIGYYLLTIRQSEGKPFSLDKYQLLLLIVYGGYWMLIYSVGGHFLGVLSANIATIGVFFSSLLITEPPFESDDDFGPPTLIRLLLSTLGPVISLQAAILVINGFGAHIDISSCAPGLRLLPIGVVFAAVTIFLVGHKIHPNRSIFFGLSEKAEGDFHFNTSRVYLVMGCILAIELWYPFIDTTIPNILLMFMCLH
jgi:hypothetical protein